MSKAEAFTAFLKEIAANESEIFGDRPLASRMSLFKAEGEYGVYGGYRYRYYLADGPYNVVLTYFLVTMDSDFDGMIELLRDELESPVESSRIDDLPEGDDPDVDDVVQLILGKQEITEKHFPSLANLLTFLFNEEDGYQLQTSYIGSFYQDILRDKEGRNC